MSPDARSQDLLAEPFTAPEKKCVILIVDDDPAMRSLLSDELQDEGCRVVEAKDGKDALSYIKSFTPDIIVTDLKMPDGGFEYLRTMKAEVPGCPIILISAFGDSQTKAKAMNHGASAYFDKPMRITDLKAAIRQVCPVNQSPNCKKAVP